MHRPGGGQIVEPGEPLDGGDVLPGFSVRLRDRPDVLAAEQQER